MMLTTEEVARRLGVKVDTVYAYVSRGVLHPRRSGDTRRSLFNADEVEAVARRGRPRRSSRPMVLDLVVESGLTTIGDRGFRYRGRDVLTLARTRSFEQVAHWLWTGQELERGAPWRAYAITVPDLPQARDRLRAAVVLSSAAEPFRADLAPSAVTGAARAMIASMVTAVSPSGHGSRAARLPLGRAAPLRDTIAGRLWARLGAGRPVPALVTTLNAALVAVTDHELAPATLAARVAASVRADPFSVVLAGLGPMSGPLHGGASTLVHEMIAEAMARGPHAAVSAALDRHGSLPGFGHRLYPDGDPRAKLLLGMIRAARDGSRAVAVAQQLLHAARRHSGSDPNIDFALATLAAAAGMPTGAGETIFTIARTAGWIAHAIEEYAEPPVRFRARAVTRRG